MESVQDWGLPPFRYEELLFFFFFLIKRKSILAVADVTENSFYKQIHVVNVEAGLKAGVVPVLETL